MLKSMTRGGKGLLDIGYRQERHGGPLVHLGVCIEKTEEIGLGIEKS